MIRRHRKKWLAALILGCVGFVNVPAEAQFETRGNFAVQDEPGAIVAGDFNHDGKLDLAVVASIGGKVAVLLGNGDGTFQPATYYTIGESVTSVATADLRKNGTLDLVAADYLDGYIGVLLGNGDGTFQAPQTVSTAPYYPGGVAVGNFGGITRTW